MDKYWIVRPDAYDIFNKIIGSKFDESQILRLKQNDIYKDGISVYKQGNLFYYRLVNSPIECEFQFEISIKALRKQKLQKINKDYGIR
jgi:hypothetical protein